MIAQFTSPAWSCYGICARSRLCIEFIEIHYIIEGPQSDFLNLALGILTSAMSLSSRSWLGWFPGFEFEISRQMVFGGSHCFRWWNPAGFWRSLVMIVVCFRNHGLWLLGLLAAFCIWLSFQFYSSTCATLSYRTFIPAQVQISAPYSLKDPWTTRNSWVRLRLQIRDTNSRCWGHRQPWDQSPAFLECWRIHWNLFGFGRFFCRWYYSLGFWTQI